MTNHYISTACYHDLHAKCRLDCKWCEEKCSCYCHKGVAIEEIAPKGDPVETMILKLSGVDMSTKLHWDTQNQTWLVTKESHAA